MVEHGQKYTRSQRHTHEARRWLSLAYTLALVVLAAGCAGKKTVAETSVGQLGCDLRVCHSDFSYSSRFCDTLDVFELDIDSTRPTKRLVRRANASATAHQSDTTAATSSSVTQTRSETTKQLTSYPTTPTWYYIIVGLLLAVFLILLIRRL